MLIENEIEIDKAIFAYGKACASLWNLMQRHPSEFPQAVLSCGTIAEYYTRIFLRAKHQKADVIYGKANEKAWDIEVITEDGEKITYQVKSISFLNKGKVIKRLVKGFDKLIIVSLNFEFFPVQVYLFDDPSIFFSTSKIRTMTIPNPDNPRNNGSKVFQFAKNITDEFNEALI